MSFATTPLWHHSGEWNALRRSVPSTNAPWSASSAWRSRRASTRVDDSATSGQPSGSTPPRRHSYAPSDKPMLKPKQTSAGPAAATRASYVVRAATTTTPPAFRGAEHAAAVAWGPTSVTTTRRSAGSKPALRRSSTDAAHHSAGVAHSSGPAPNTWSWPFLLNASAASGNSRSAHEAVKEMDSALDGPPATPARSASAASLAATAGAGATSSSTASASSVVGFICDSTRQTVRCAASSRFACARPQ
mmetsp:Transcript_1839/g.5209  ORF Transcript_1839/g.5209 Transcript_1839/m.5209 type:complete len:247 (-) Transcript_1839:140-880(-)